jgi:hypothetical protein
MAWDCKDWKAWCDHMPGPAEPTLHLRGLCTFPTPGYQVALRISATQGVAYPKALDVDLIVTEPTEGQPEVMTDVKAELTREGGPEHDTVNIKDLGISVEVDHVEKS